MAQIAFFLVVAAATAGITASPAPATGHEDEAASPIYGVIIPPGYRAWRLIATNQLLVPGKVDQLRARNSAMR